MEDGWKGDRQGMGFRVAAAAAIGCETVGALVSAFAHGRVAALTSPGVWAILGQACFGTVVLGAIPLGEDEFWHDWALSRMTFSGDELSTMSQLRENFDGM